MIMGRRKAPKRGKPQRNQDPLPLAGSLALLKDELLTLQTSCSMARVGTTRATATEIADMVGDQYGTSVTPSFVGKVFSTHKMRRAISHGRPKLVLDLDQLEAARQSVCTKLEELVPQVQKDLGHYDDLVQEVTMIADRAQKVQSLMRRKDAINRFLAENYAASRRLSFLAGHAARLQNELDQAKLVQKQCKALQRKVDALPDLEDRKMDLESSLEQFASDESLISTKERDLQGRIQNLQKRTRWVTMAELDAQIAQVKKELDSLSEQLGEKRTLLGRMFGKDRGEQAS